MPLKRACIECADWMSVGCAKGLYSAAGKMFNAYSILVQFYHTTKSDYIPSFFTGVIQLLPGYCISIQLDIREIRKPKNKSTKKKVKTINQQVFEVWNIVVWVKSTSSLTLGEMCCYGYNSKHGLRLWKCDVRIRVRVSDPSVQTHPSTKIFSLSELCPTIMKFALVIITMSTRWRCHLNVKVCLLGHLLK